MATGITEQEKWKDTISKPRVVCANIAFLDTEKLKLETPIGETSRKTGQSSDPV